MQVQYRIIVRTDVRSVGRTRKPIRVGRRLMVAEISAMERRDFIHPLRPFRRLLGGCWEAGGYEAWGERNFHAKDSHNPAIKPTKGLGKGLSQIPFPIRSGTLG